MPAPPTKKGHAKPFLSLVKGKPELDLYFDKRCTTQYYQAALQCILWCCTFAVCHSSIIKYTARRLDKPLIIMIIATILWPTHASFRDCNPCNITIYNIMWLDLGKPFIWVSRASCAMLIAQVKILTKSKISMSTNLLCSCHLQRLVEGKIWTEKRAFFKFFFHWMKYGKPSFQAP